MKFIWFMKFRELKKLRKYFFDSDVWCYICNKKAIMEFGFERLEVWKKSRVLVKEIYEVAGQLPADEKYGLSDQ